LRQQAAFPTFFFVVKAGFSSKRFNRFVNGAPWDGFNGQPVNSQGGWFQKLKGGSPVKHAVGFNQLGALECDPVKSFQSDSRRGIQVNKKRSATALEKMFD
jgi:hypothetical protein